MKQINFIPDAGTQKLYSCTIYVGVAQKTAKDNPIPVYLDNSLTQPIIIPLRGDVGQVYPAQYLVPLQISGAFNYNNVFIDANDYSIQVISDNGTVLFESISVIDDTLQNASFRIFKSVSDIALDQSMDNGDLAFLSRFFNDENTNDSIGMLIYESKLPKSWHDGVLFFSPSVPYTDDDDYYQGVNETQPNGLGIWRMQNGRAPRSLVVSVPTQTPTIPIAIELLKDIKPAIDSTVTIKIEHGYELSEEIKCVGVNLSHVVIQADHTIPVSSDFKGNSVFYVADGAIAPYINATFDLQDKAGVIGLSCRIGSSAVIGAGKGFINSGDHSLSVYVGSNVSAIGSVFTNSRKGVYASTASTIALDSADLSGCKSGKGLYLTDNSSASFNNGKINNCNGNEAITVVGGSTLDIRATEINNCKADKAMYLASAKVAADRIQMKNCEQIGIMIEDSSDLSVTEAQLSSTNNASYGLYIRKSSSCGADGINISGFNTGIHAESSSRVDASSSQITNNGYTGVRLLSGSSGSIQGSTITSGDFNVNIQDGSTCCAVNCTVSGAKLDAVLCQFSSKIDARNLKIENAARQGIGVFEGSTASIAYCQIKNCGDRGIDVRTASTVDCENATVTNCTNRGIQALDNSRIHAKNSTVDGCSWGITSSTASTVEATGSLVKNYTEYGFRAMYSSTLNANNGIVYKSQSGTPNNNDVRVSYGSNIGALNTWCDTQKTVKAGTSQATNNLTANGVIYD